MADKIICATVQPNITRMDLKGHKTGEGGMFQVKSGAPSIGSMDCKLFMYWILT